MFIVFVTGCFLGALTKRPLDIEHYTTSSELIFQCQLDGGVYTVNNGQEFCQIITTKETFRHVLEP